jgi:hypothetical protein
MVKKNDRDIKSFEEFIDEILSFHDNILTKTSNYMILYRGQENDWDLLPKIARPDYKTEDVRKTEIKVMEDFEKLGYPYYDNIKLNQWDRLALAQHHRLPTRLLDWTENPYIALWFAFINDYKIKDKIAGKRVVWTLIIEEDEVVKDQHDSPYDFKRTVVFRPPHIVPTISSQSGWFTLHRYMKTEKRFVPLNKNKNYKKKLIKYKFSEKIDKNEILRKLSIVNINSHTVFPDLYGLCDYLYWKYYKITKLPFG